MNLMPAVTLALVATFFIALPLFVAN